ncbi:MAG: hypothetical protein ACU84H_10700 [Gammaproteobacteria bacterium]
MSDASLLTPVRKSYIEETILILLLMLSLAGIFINDFSPADGYGYWVMMVFVFAPFAMIIGWLQSKHRSDDFKSILREQTLHWLTTLLVVGCASLVQKSDVTAAGRMILLILALATMLDGMRVGWRFSLVGFFLGFSAVIPSYTEHFFWIELGIAVIIVALTLLWEIWSNKKIQP